MLQLTLADRALSIALTTGIVLIRGDRTFVELCAGSGTNYTHFLVRSFIVFHRARGGIHFRVTYTLDNRLV